jgi:hypothetical protein
MYFVVGIELSFSKCHLRWTTFTTYKKFEYVHFLIQLELAVVGLCAGQRGSWLHQDFVKALSTLVKLE